MNRIKTPKPDEIFPWQPDELSGTNPARLMNFIDGKWVEAKKYKDVLDPMSGEPFIQMPDTSVQELAPFIRSLAKCPKYGLHNPILNVERYLMYGQISERVADFLRSSEGERFFTRLIQRVMPKDTEQCRNEVTVTATFLENFSGDQVRFLAKGQTTPGNHFGQEAIDYRWPHGPVAVITPFNFPLEIMALQTMGALYMGNKPVLKQATTTSIAAEAFVRLLLHCGMPEQDLLLIHCSGAVMEKLATNPAIQFTQFTGSTSVAEQLLELTKGKCRIEDAGFDWKIVGPNAIPSMVDFVAAQCDMDAYAASGQKCSAQSFLAVHQNWVKLGLLEKIAQLAAKRSLGDLTIGPVLTWTNEIIEAHIDKLLRINGAKIQFGGKRLKRNSIPSCYGSFEPTAVFVPLKSIPPHVDLVTTEVFGPVQVITTWESKDDLRLLLDICNSMQHHLTAGVVDNDPDFLNQVLGQTVNGTTYAGIRARTTGAPQWHFFGPCGHPAAAG
ncbi:MAG: aldehyde dehydrogenase family protein, partial [Dehalococcoidia bacterium]|nr:aldehyde dehydrogenase family protein [Dehalococcoidia bacterium]